MTMTTWSTAPRWRSRVCRLRRRRAAVGPHAHQPRLSNTADRYRMSRIRGAGGAGLSTATSTRGRGEVNSFNVVRVEPERVEVDRYGWDEVGGKFSLMKTEPFLRRGNVWSAHTEGLFATGI
ncbi:hypothetical protein LP420_05835 [Massilia sp. B-10]|nr:hypothetical protein LP420_05835 [Massilia sp. B-10]